MVCQERRQREANRVHCRETRLRKRGLEQQLVKEAEVLCIYRDIVEGGPDLFSCHGVSCDAPFTLGLAIDQTSSLTLFVGVGYWMMLQEFVCESFQERLRLAQNDVLDLPLASIVDPRDSALLGTAVDKVLEDHETRAKARDGDGEGGGIQGGSLVYLRVGWGGLLFSASMTITIGTQGMIVVTRIYDALRET